MNAITRTADNYLAKRYDTSPDWDCYGARFGGYFDAGFAWQYELTQTERAAAGSFVKFAHDVRREIEKMRND